MNGFNNIPMAVAVLSEGTEYTPETPTAAANAIPVLECNIRTEVQRSQARIRSPRGGRMSGIVTSRRASYSLVTPLYGSGVSTGNIVVPRVVSEILQTAFALDTATTADECVATPAPHNPTLNGSAEDETFTLSKWNFQKGSIAAGTKVFQKIHGCRINRLSIAARVGDIARMTIDGPGLYNEDADVTDDLTGFDPNSWGSEFITPNEIGMTIGGVAVSIDGFELVYEFGAAHEDGSGAGGGNGNGVVGTSIGEPIVTLNVSPRLMVQSTLDLMNQVHAGAEVAIGMTANGIFPPTKSGGDGYGWKFSATKAQANTQGYDAGQNPVRLPMVYDLNKASILGDEVSMTWL